LSSPEPRSIHYRRRWAYALWVLLLAVAGGALVAWRIPVSRGEGRVLIALQIPQAPSGTRVDLWCGPSSRWRPGRFVGTLGPVVTRDGRLVLGPFPVPIARRRWMKVFHPDTADLILFRISSPEGMSCYASYNLGPDLYSGFLAERRKMILTLTLPWGHLPTDPAAPFKIQ